MSDTAAIPRDEFFESLLGDFLDESGQLLDRLNENMLQLDEWFRSLDDAGIPPLRRGFVERDVPLRP